MRDLVELASHYRFRAEDARRIAEGIYDHVDRKKLVQIAEDYEELARQAEAKTIAPGRLV
jgi:hypothetical protein